MTNTSIFPIPEIECMIIDYLDFPKDAGKLMSVNKYYNKLIKYNPLFMEFERFYVDKKKGSINETSNPNNRNLYLACKYCYTLIPKYLLQKYSLNVREDNDYAFRLACYANNFELAKWLYSLDDKINIRSGGGFPFCICCKNGNFEMAKWLYSLDDQINIHVSGEFTFRTSCENGHFEIAKWLYFLNNRINIHAMSEYVFRLSCKNGHLEIAKLLYSLDEKINIRSMQDYAFRLACENDHIEIAEWLCTLCDKYVIEKKLKAKILN